MFTAKVTNVSVIANENSANVQLTLNAEFDGFKIVNGVATTAKVNTISFPRSVIIAQLCECNDDIALYRAMCDRSFGQKEFGGILFGATITVERILHAAGEVVNDYVFQRDCYSTQITSVHLSTKATTLLDKAISL